MCDSTERLAGATAMLRARVARTGATLHAFEDVEGKTVFVVTRWNLSSKLHSQAELEDWLDRVGVTS
jgi:hypothetical protein